MNANAHCRAILGLLSDGVPRTGREIAHSLGITQGNYTCAAWRLAKSGRIVRADGCCKITPAGVRSLETGLKGCHAGAGRRSLRARAWHVMRMSVWFGVSDLLRAVADGTETNAARGIGRYIRVLALAGYLTEKRQQPGRWHLSRNTGRLAPSFNSVTRTVTDPNSGEVFDV